MFAAAAAGRTDDPEAVRVIDHQPGAVGSRGIRERGQRGEVAIHTEHPIGDEERTGSLRSVSVVRCERCAGGCGIAVRIALQVSAAHQPGGVDQRGMVQLVAEQQVVATGECTEHPEVRHIAGGEHQGTGTTGELSEFTLESLVFGAVSADEVRGPGARTVALRRFSHRSGDPRVAGEAEIVVAAEIDAAVLGRRAAPAQVALVEVAQRSGARLRRAAHRALPQRCACRAASTTPGRARHRGCRW